MEELLLERTDVAVAPQEFRGCRPQPSTLDFCYVGVALSTLSRRGEGILYSRNPDKKKDPAPPPPSPTTHSLEQPPCHVGLCMCVCVCAKP